MEIEEKEEVEPTKNYYIPIPIQEERNYDLKDYDSEYTEESNFSPSHKF